MNVLVGLLLGGLIAGVGIWLLYRKRGWVDVSPQLRTMPVRRMKYLLAGTFFLGVAIAFVMDLFNGTLTRTVVVGLAFLFGAIFVLIQLLGKFVGAARVALVIPLGAIVYYIESHHAGTAAPGTLASAYRFDGYVICIRWPHAWRCSGGTSILRERDNCAPRPNSNWPTGCKTSCC